MPTTRSHTLRKPYHRFGRTNPTTTFTPGTYMRSVILLIILFTSGSASAHDGPFFSLEHIDTIVLLACFGVVAAFGCVARFTDIKNPFSESEAASRKR